MGAPFEHPTRNPALKRDVPQAARLYISVTVCGPIQENLVEPRSAGVPLASRSFVHIHCKSWPLTLGGGWDICAQADQDCGGADDISNLRVVK